MQQRMKRSSVIYIDEFKTLVVENIYGITLIQSNNYQKRIFNYHPRILQDFQYK